MCTILSHPIYHKLTIKSGSLPQFIHQEWDDWFLLLQLAVSEGWYESIE
jgi:hypothetical protein